MLSEQEQLARADQAERLLNDPMLKEALDNLKEGVMSQILVLPIAGHDDEKRRLLDYRQIIQVFEGHLKKHIQTGEMVKQNLKDKNMFNPSGV